MKSPSLGIAAAMILMTLTSCNSTPQRTSDQDMIDAADTLQRALIEAYNRGDAKAVTKLYWDSPDVVMFPTDRLQARGIGAIRQMMSPMDGKRPSSRLEAIESHHVRAGEVVIGWGLWQVTSRGPDKREIKTIGRYTDVKGQRDGKWVYLLDHSSMPLPAMAMKDHAQSAE